LFIALAAEHAYAMALGGEDERKLYKEAADCLRAGGYRVSYEAFVGWPLQMRVDAYAYGMRVSGHNWEDKDGTILPAGRVPRPRWFPKNEETELR
jgi:hypothetical protein